MGGRGSSSGRAGGTGGIATSNRIKNEFLQNGLNSKFKGVRRDAENGTGSYTYKDAKAVTANEALKMDVLRVHEKGDNTLVEGLVNGKHSFYANSNSDSTIKYIKNTMELKKQKQVSDIKSTDRPEIRTTSTYNRWKKNHDADFEAWYYGNTKN